MSQRSTQVSRATKYVTWTLDMDKVAMDTFVDEYHKGNIADNGWKPQTFQAVIDAVDAKLGTKLTKDNIRSRIKTWKRTYTAIIEILSVSGFGWNNITKMIDATDIDWANYLKSNPTAAQFRNRSIPDYDHLALIIGNDQATCVGAMTGIEAEAADKQTVALDGDDLDDFTLPTDFNSNVEANTPISSPTPQTCASSSRTKGGRKKMKRRESGDDTMTEIVATMKVLAEAIQATSDKVDVKLVMSEVMKIEDFDQRLILESMEFISSDARKADLFLVLPEDMRKAWLLMRLRGI